MITLSQAEQIALTYNAANDAIRERWGETFLVPEKTEEHDWGWVFTFEGEGADWPLVVYRRGELRHVVERNKGLLRRVGSAGLKAAIGSLLMAAKDTDGDEEQEAQPMEP